QPPSTGVYTVAVTVTSSGSGASLEADVTIYSYEALYHSSSASGTLTLTCPEASLTLALNLTGPTEAWLLVLPAEMLPPEPGGILVYPMVDVRVEPLDGVSWPALITITYTDEALAQLGASEESLTPLHYNPQTGSWEPFADYTLDTRANRLTIHPTRGELAGSIIALTAEPAGGTSTASQPPSSTSTTPAQTPPPTSSSTSQGATTTTGRPGGGLPAALILLLIAVLAAAAVLLLRRR
ncbi:MAG: hypothetical protein LRS49_00600, partial [Desulfurococcales archaeon]|nr:hypothetical protein [Desulfurococcales archaeon]